MKLYETIGAKNWERGRGHNKRGDRMCLSNHLICRYKLLTGARQETTRLREAIAVLFPDRLGESDRKGPIATFNDHPDTTLDDVLRVCKLADV